MPLVSKLTLVFIVLALIGFVDAGYLTVEHYRGVVPDCTLNGCGTVLTSPYATVGSVPVAAIGAFYYLALFLMSLGSFALKRPGLIYFGAIIVAAGFLITLRFLYLQFFVLHALCAFCLGSALTTTLLAVTSVFILRNRQQ